jgi:L-malate glycosyltransferase
MIKVLHITPDFNCACGVTRHVSLLLNELSRNKELEIHFVTNKGDALDRIKELNIKTELLNFHKDKKNLFVFIKNLLWLRNYCRKNKISIIHSHHRYLELLSFLTGKLLKIHTVATVHSLVEGWRYFSFKSDKIIAISKTVESSLVNIFNVPCSRISQLYYFVKSFEKPDADTLIKLKIQLGIGEPDRILLFVGRINYIKGFDVLAEVFQKLASINPHLKLLVVGEYESDDYGKMLNDKNIIYVKSKKDVQNYYFLADIVLLPSRIEPLGFVMLEAGLAKKPLIGGKTGGIAEFIENEIHGLLVEPGSADDLYNAVIRMLNNNEQAAKMGENLYNKVTALNSATEYCNEIIKQYTRLVEHDSE